MGWFALYWIIVLNGGFMTGFGPSGPGDPQSPKAINWNQIVMDAALSVSCIIPILALWIPSRILIGLSAVILLPATLLGLLLLTIPPVGLAILATVFSWYYAAYSRWCLLAPTNSPNLHEPEQFVAPNRSLAPTLNPTSSVRGPEDW